MIDQLKKLKNKSVIVIILSLLALTWQFLNYLAIKEYVPFEQFGTFEILIIYSSYIFFLILLLALFSLTYTSFRVIMKYNAEKKKLEKEKSNSTTQNIDISKETK